MAFIESFTLEVADPTAASRFYTAAFGLGTQLRVRASEAPATGFRGFTLSLTVSQPATVSGLIGAPDGFAWEAASLTCSRLRLQDRRS